MQDYLRIGVVSKSHGVKGEVKVFPTTDDKKRFDDLINVTVYFKSKTQSMTEHVITGVKYFKDMVIVKFDDINDMDSADLIRGVEIYIDRDNAVPLEEGEYYIADLLGLEVRLEDGSKFGTLKDVMETGANDVYIVDSINNGEVLLPVIDECIKDVDLEEGIITVHIMKGLI